MFRKDLKRPSALPSLPVFLLWCSALCVSPALSQDASLKYRQMVTDSLYDSPQRIHLMSLHRDSLRAYEIEFAHEGTELQGTSEFARKHEALAAINGSFFDMDQGGSVCYFEVDDSVISRNRSTEAKWAVADSITNAALILDREAGLRIESARSEQFYELSDQEDFVMVSGPLLIKDSILQALPDLNFSHTRHPRTCMGITAGSIIFIIIDGRSEEAAGMSLGEVQSFLHSLGCLDAINLDGGGSSTMWIRGMGIVNQPSDQSGERPVANALIIRKYGNENSCDHRNEGTMHDFIK